MVARVLKLPRTEAGRRHLLCALKGGSSDVWETPDNWGIDWDSESEGVEEAAANFGRQFVCADGEG